MPCPKERNAMNLPIVTRGIYMYAHDYDPMRVARLEKTAIYIIGYSIGRGVITTESEPIVAMKDHKGTLIVLWSNLSMKNKCSRIANEAWRLVGREPEINVIHRIMMAGDDWLTLLCKNRLCRGLSTD